MAAYRSDEFYRLVHPEDRGAVDLAVARALAGTESYDLEFRLVAPDGTIRWVRDRARVTFDDEGSPVRMAGVCADITEHKQAVAAWRAGEKRFRALIEKSGDVVALIASDGRVQYASPAIFPTLGYAPAEILDRPASELIHPEDLPRVTRRFRQLLDQPGASVDYEFRCRHKDGSWRWIEGTGTNLLTNASLQAVVANLRDVTGRKQAEEVLRFQKSLLEAQSEASIDGILVVSASQEIIFFNRRFVEMWRLSEAVVASRAGQPALQAAMDQLVDPQAFLDRIAFMRDHPHEVSRDEILLKDGRTFDRYIAPVKGEDGAYYGRVVSFRDVTERKQLEQQCRQSQKMEAIGRLAGGVAHDFNNMIGAITGYADLLLHRASADDTVRCYLQEILKAGERAATLTRQLLAFSRKGVVAPQVLDLNEVVPTMHQMLRRLIGDDIELVTLPNATPATVKADPGQIEQVLLNLAVNARDAMPQGGKLTIALRDLVLAEDAVGRPAGVEPGAYVVLEVSDSGCGMDAETMARIFEPFFTTKERGKGTGLGLATVYAIVQQSGGQIEVESWPGDGSIFRIYLPRTEEARQPDEAGETLAGAAAGSGTILLVEDEPTVRGMVQEVLRMQGYTVLEAIQGDDALRVCAEYTGPIDLLLTDVMMPGMSGRELAERAAAVRPATKVLFMSGYTDDAMVRDGVSASGIAFIQKPFKPAALARIVREVLGSGRETTGDQQQLVRRLIG